MCVSAAQKWRGTALDNMLLDLMNIEPCSRHVLQPHPCSRSFGASALRAGLRLPATQFAS